jgi:hypothetical protein
MVTEVDDNDLRILSLLHALCDRDEFIREAVRLLQTSSIDETSWQMVRGMASDVAPDHALFDPDKTIEQLRGEFVDIPQDGGRRIIFERCTRDRRAVQRRAGADRRSDDRRATMLPWLGEERRATDRRRARRRKQNLLDLA